MAQKFNRTIITNPPIKQLDGSFNIQGFKEEVPPEGEHLLESIDSIHGRPDISFRVQLRHHSYPHYIHWVTALTMQPYNILPNFLNSLKGRKLCSLRRHHLRNLITCKINIPINRDKMTVKDDMELRIPYRPRPKPCKNKKSLSKARKKPKVK